MAATKKTGANRKPLASMTLKELRRTYRLIYGLDTASTSKPDLRKCIAARRAKRTKVRAGRRAMVNAERDPRLPPLGTVLTRVHDGAIHRATVREAGFEYRRRTYASLSSVAKAITGCNWNGFGFFNLLRKSPGIEGEGGVVNDFHRTGMGQKFFEATLPNLARQIARLADGVERAVRLLEEERASANAAAKGPPQ